MAFESSTATNAADLWSKLISFLTTNSALSAAGDAWQVVWAGTGINGGDLHTDGVRRTDLVVKGPGLTGTDEVYVALRLHQDATNDRYIIYTRGCTGVITSAESYTQHVNMSAPVAMFLDSNPVSYWFVANGRRFVVVQKITTVFEAMYAGLYLPYAFPTTYPYPLFIGGSASGGYDLENTWRSTDNTHRHFTDPYSYAESSTTYYPSCATFITPDALWQKVANYGDPGSGNWSSMLPYQGGTGFGARPDPAINTESLGYNRVLSYTRQAFGGQMTLTPLTLVQRTGGETTFGVLDGCYHCPGVGNGAQNIITVGGVDHLVVQNVFRTGLNNFWALRLE